MVPREVWHRADDLLLQAALLDADATMPTWEWIAREYEAWQEYIPTHTRLSVAPSEA